MVTELSPSITDTDSERDYRPLMYRTPGVMSKSYDESSILKKPTGYSVSEVEQDRLSSDSDGVIYQPKEGRQHSSVSMF